MNSKQDDYNFKNESRFYSHPYFSFPKTLLENYYRITNISLYLFTYIFLFMSCSLLTQELNKSPISIYLSISLSYIYIYTLFSVQR